MASIPVGAGTLVRVGGIVEIADADTGYPPIGSRGFFESILDTSVNPFVVMDEKLVVVYTSSSLTALLGWEQGYWIGRSMLDMLDAESLAYVLPGFVELSRSKRPPDWVGAPVRVRMHCADGSLAAVDGQVRPSSVTGVAGYVAQLERAGGALATSDAIEMTLQGSDLDEALALLSSVIEHDVPDTVAALGLGWDGERFGQVVGAATLLALDDPGLVDRTVIDAALRTTRDVADLFDHLAPATRRAATEAGMAACWFVPTHTTSEGGQDAALFVWHPEPGLPNPITEISVRRVANLIRVALRSIGQRRALTWQATHDHLTELCNRGEFTRRLAATTGCRRALLYCDLDDFKPVNDELGHVVGDQVLSAVAGRLRHACGEHLVARLGGDEFAVLISDVPGIEAAEEVAVAVLNALASPISVMGRHPKLGISVGLAYDADGSMDADHLVAEADRMLREAKVAGKNQIGSGALVPAP
jgi:diguanylate cyclase (GGDEF)-like protein/PAS domain S-box-containing protein